MKRKLTPPVYKKSKYQGMTSDQMRNHKDRLTWKEAEALSKEKVFHDYSK